MADAVPVLGREPQVDGERGQVVGDAGDRGGIAALPGSRERRRLLAGDRHGLVAGLGVADVEDRSELGLHLGLVMGGHLGQGVAGAVDQTPLAQAGRERPVKGAGEPWGAVADPQQRRPQAALGEVGEEVGPGVGRLRRRRRQPTNTGLPSVSIPQAAKTGSAGAPGCILKWLASKNR